MLSGTCCFSPCNRDGKFSEELDAFAQTSGTEIIKLPARSLNLNGYAERWVRGVEDKPGQVVILNREVTQLLGSAMGQGVWSEPSMQDDIVEKEQRD
jgi:hypothetical protein